MGKTKSAEWIKSSDIMLDIVEACIREVQEEAGLKINLYNPVNSQLNNSCELGGEKNGLFKLFYIS